MINSYSNLSGDLKKKGEEVADLECVKQEFLIQFLASKYEYLNLKGGERPPHPQY